MAVPELGTGPVVGSVLPRLWTRPLVTGPPGPCGCGCPLTPDTTDGFQVDDWARRVLRAPLRGWQRWAVIHGLELDAATGGPRFRTVLLEAGRQNGKTRVPGVLSSWWQFGCDVPLILGTSTKVDYARESWQHACALVEAAPALTGLRARRWRREANGEQESWSRAGARYKISAANAEGGRSLTVHRLILDELRQHHSYDAWSASVYAGNAVADFQVWALSNAGTDASIVLNELHDACAEFIRTGVGDPTAALFSWSCPDDADPLDVAALAAANPSLGDGITAAVLLGQAAKAVQVGGQLLAEFKTEVMCIRQASGADALDGGAWKRAAVPAPIPATTRVAGCLDIAPDGAHGTLAVAALETDADGRERVRVETVAAWDDLELLRRQLPDWVGRVQPYVLGWYPAGPAAALDTALRDRRKSGVRGWPPPRVRVVEIGAELGAVCMGFAAAVAGDGVRHSGQALLDAQVIGAARRTRGDAWVFDRRPGGVHVDALYAVAGAAHLARTMPAPRQATRLRVIGD